jgi:hypothetical protein
MDSTSKQQLDDIKKTPLMDIGHIFKFSKSLQVYYCKHCSGVRSPKLRNNKK